MTQSDEESNMKAQAVTGPALYPTHTPAWEQELNVEVNREKIVDEG